MIRRANIDEYTTLTDISFAAKRYWKYPQEYLDIWKDELTITSEYIAGNDVFVIEIDNIVAGYYSIVELTDYLEICGVVIKKGYWLDHMFLLPQYIGKGYGTAMFNHFRDYCNDNQLGGVGIMADPNASGFYRKMGCVYIGELPSNIEGRTTPYFELRE